MIVVAEGPGKVTWSAPWSLRPRRPRTAPTWGGGPCRRAASSSFKASGQCPGELFGAHAGCLTLETFNHPQLIAGKVVTVSGERALEVLPRLSKELGVFRCPACQVPYYVLAQDHPQL
jgi:hypothetical protein